jgi:hypothetical protein
MAKSKKYNRQKPRSIGFQEMREYISHNITPAVRKLKRWKKNDLYKGSPAMQVANKNLRSLYQKYGMEETKYHAGKIFRDQIKSYEDLRSLYATIYTIQGADAKEARVQLNKNIKDFERAKQIWSALGKKVSNTSYIKAFDTLSYLSQEFHELFAILTYNEVKVALAESDNPIDVFEKYTSRLKNKILTEKQQEYSKKLNEKIWNSDISPLDLSYIFKK